MTKQRKESSIEELRGVIRKLHGAKATYVESVPVKEVFQGQTVWDGVVEVFDLKGHPKTHRAYAWTHATDDPKHPRKSVTVLHIPPAISPQTAVQAVILQEIRSNARPQAQA
jgi:hypothetical protein